MVKPPNSGKYPGTVETGSTQTRNRDPLALAKGGSGTISRRLRLALFALSATTILTGGIGLLAFQVVREAIEESNRVALPLAQTAAGLLASVDGYQASIDRLSALPRGADSAAQADRLRQAAVGISQYINELEDLAGRSEHTAMLRTHSMPIAELSEERLRLVAAHSALDRTIDSQVARLRTQLRQLSANLELLLLETSEQMHATTLRIKDKFSRGAASSQLSRELIDLVDHDAALIESIAGMETAVTRLNSTLELVLRDSTTLAVEDRAAEFSLSLRAITGPLSRFADTTARQAVSKDLSRLFELGIGPRNLFSLRHERLRLTSALQDNTISVRAINETLRMIARELVDQTSRRAEMANARATSAMRTGTLLMVTVSLIAMIAAITISTRYVLRRIVDPMNALIRSLERLAAGELDAPIPIAVDSSLARLTEALVVFRDHVRLIDHQKELLAEQTMSLARNEKRLMMATRGANAAIWERLDMSKSDVYWSPAHYTMLGLDPDEPVGHDMVMDLMHPADKPLHESALERHLQEGAPYAVEFRLRHADGRYRWFYATGLAEQDPNTGVFTMVGSLIDISERKKAEQDLIEHARELRRSNEELEQFAAVASHDLQEPLRMVVSYCDLLRRRHSAALEGEAREFLDFAVDGAIRMQHLIKSLLEYSRAGSESMTSAAVSVDRPIEASVRDLSALIAETNAKVNVQGTPGIVLGDEVMLARVFLNLIQNAIKFNDSDAPVIDVCMGRENGQAVITVTDNGIGVQERYRERVFDLFGRLHSARRYAGSGIGLSVSRRIIQRHGGTLRLDEEQPEAGSRFRIEIPEMTDC